MPGFETLKNSQGQKSSQLSIFENYSLFTCGLVNFDIVQDERAKSSELESQ